MTNVLNAQFNSFVNYLKTGGTGTSLAFGKTTLTVNLNGLNDLPAQKQAATNALALWSISTGLKFSITTGTADITVDNNLANAYTNTWWSGDHLTRATINIAKDWVSDWSIGEYGVQTFIHEFGHALGLSHPGPYNGNGTYASDAIFDVDTWQYSVMSYFQQPNYDNASQLYLIMPMIGDIAAIRAMYGALAANTGNTVYGRGETVYGGWTDFSKYAESTFTVNDTSGNDTLDFSNTTPAANIYLTAGYFSDVNGYKGNVAIALGTVIENAFGGSGSDLISGNAVGNLLRGNGGADSLYGIDGNDVLNGGAGGDYLNGGNGLDTASYSTAATAVTVNIATPGANTGEAAGDRLVLIENIEGSGFSDILTGDGLANTLMGGRGNDQLNGGLGNDSLVGGLGADYLNGGTGVDLVSYADSTVGLRVSLLSSSLNNGIATGDRYVSIENVAGSAYADNLSGDNLNNFVWGNAGNDLLYGNGGNDALYGGAGNDTLVGGAGIDTLCGDFGQDKLYGGTGGDRFYFRAITDSTNAVAGRDIIYDFKLAEGDRVNLIDIDANARIAGNQAFTYIGTAAFSGVAGQLHVQYTSGSTYVTADVNGDKIADFGLTLYNVNALSSACYLL